MTFYDILNLFMTVMKIRTRERLYKIRKEKDEEREDIEVEIVSTKFKFHK